MECEKAINDVERLEDIIDITIIGGGPIGCALADELAAQGGYKTILVLERGKIPEENSMAMRSNRVSHAGIYYNRITEPNKAFNCRRGNELVRRRCISQGLPFVQTGKLVIASANQLDFLEDLLETANENGVPDVRIITRREITEFEPALSADYALLVPSSGVVDPVSYVLSLKASAAEKNVIFFENQEVVGVKATDEEEPETGFEITTELKRNRKQGTNQGPNKFYNFQTRIVVNAAGLYAGEVARMINPETDIELIFMGGDSVCYSTGNEMVGYRADISVRMLVYPVPVYQTPTGESVSGPIDELKRRAASGELLRTVGIHTTPQGIIRKRDGSFDVGHEIVLGPAKTRVYLPEDFCDTPLKPVEYYHGHARQLIPAFADKELFERIVHLNERGIMAIPGRDFVMQQDSRYGTAYHFICDSPGLTSAESVGKEGAHMIINALERPAYLNEK